MARYWLIGLVLLVVGGAGVWLRGEYMAHTQELFMQGLAYSGGDGQVAADPKRGFALLLQAAERGHADAMMLVALDYELGGGAPYQSLAEAEKWYRRAAELEQPEAKDKVLQYEGLKNGKI